MPINAKTTPINDTDYNCHITAVELSLTNHMGFISCLIMPLVINSLGADTHTHTHTQTHTHTHTDDPHRINFNKPGARRQHSPGLKICALILNLVEVFRTYVIKGYVTGMKSWKPSLK